MTDPLTTASPDTHRLPEPAAISADSFAALVDEHHAKLCNFLLRYTHNRHDAEDLCQDTFVKAYKNLHRYDPRYPFATWLYIIARRTAINHHRDTRPTEALTFELEATDHSPDAQLETHDQHAALWSTVATLKPAYREAITLKYRENLSIEEIARVMAKTQVTVKILLFRARHQLKKLL